MKTERYNIFKKVHKNLGCLLFETGTLFQKMDNTDPEEMNILMEQVMQITGYFDHHIRREEYVIYNAVATIAPFIVSDMEKTNEKNCRLASSIEKVIKSSYPLNNSIPREFVTELQTLFFSFTAAILLQINREVTVINELLWENYSDDQLMTLEENLINKQKVNHSDRDELNNELIMNTQTLFPWINSVEAA